MNMNLKGFRNNCGDGLMGGLIIFKGRALTESETRILVNYGIEKGYETIADIPDEIVEEICKEHGNADWMRKYDDTPEFVSIPRLQQILERLRNSYACNYDFDPEELINDIQDEL